MPKFKAIIKPESFCTCSFKALEDKELLFKTYPGDKDNCEIFEENEAGDGEKYERMKEKGEMDHCFCQMSPENEDVEQPGREQEANDDGGSSQVN